jgi:hypothetical protein
MSGDIQTINPGLASGAPVKASQITGTTTNDNAAAGFIGEFITATVATPGGALSTGTTANVGSISLTAGDWDIANMVNFLLTAATVTLLQAGPSLTTATLPSQAGGAGLGTDGLSTFPFNATTASVIVQIPATIVRLSIAATTTVFLTVQATFSVGTVSAYGTIRARRAR